MNELLRRMLDNTTKGSWNAAKDDEYQFVESVRMVFDMGRIQMDVTLSEEVIELEPNEIENLDRDVVEELFTYIEN